MDAVRAQGFAFTYPDAPARTFGPLDWRVAEGSFTLLLGATGCGKTTLLRCLKPALAPTGAQEGCLEVLGCAPGAFDAADGAAQVGYVAQNPENQLVCDTVWHELAFGLENIGLGQNAMRRRVAEVAHFFGIEPWFRAPVADLSGGQQQMVNLAAVLALQPRLLVLDEPTAQLDPVAEKNFLHALFRVNRELGITVVMATHAPEATAPYATDLVELANGQVRPVAVPPILAPVPASAPAAPRPLVGHALDEPETPPPDAEKGAGGSTSSCVEGVPSEPESPRSPAGEDARLPLPRVEGAPYVPARLSLDALKGARLSPRPRGVSLPLHAEGATDRSESLSLGEEAAPRPTREVPPAATREALPVLSFRDVHFRYAREDGWVLRGLDLDVRAGDVHAVVGGNGCGKSTLLRLAAGVLKPERGRVANRLAARQALLPQNPKALFVCDTVADELREWQRGCGYGDDAVDAALERFSLAAHAARHPYDLSGGQQQLLAFAKILLTDPDLLLLDEPTKGLDTPTKCALAGAVRACARRGATVVLVTHDLAFAARVADRATMLFDGEAACTEPAGEFFAGNLFYRPVPDAFFRTWRDGAEVGSPGSSAPASDGGTAR